MKFLRITSYAKSPFWVVIIFSILFSAAFFSGGVRAQLPASPLAIDDSQSLPPKWPPPEAAAVDADNKKFVINRDFRVEKVPVDGAGAEIITIFVKLTGLTNSPQEKAEEVPLVSILRDTLGDDRIENDRLRYVWMLTYTKSSFAQRLAAAIPFLYMRTTNKGDVGSGPPPAVIDLNPSKKDVWDKVFWMVFRNLVLEDFGVPTKAATRQYQANLVNYRKSAIARALAVLSLYEAVEGEKILSDVEMKDIQGRMLLSNKFLGSSVNGENLERVYQKNVEKVRDLRGHNWELLRQYAEAQGLYFEPLEMPDGSATHALVWVADSDLETNREKKFDARFLNIKSPWNDPGLLKWKGYRQTRWFDEDNRAVGPDTPNAKPKHLIPLALYGLDYPKIPVLLVDFRDKNNAKKREMSRRVLDDLTKNLLSVSKFGNLPYFVGHYVYDFVTARRGMDMNQTSRFRSYSQLKLLLSLNASLDPAFRDEIAGRLESTSLNPLENDLEVEVKLARRQYENLIAYARRAGGGGLAARIEKDRRQEMTALKHGARERMLHSLGNILSFGLYKHREEYTPQLHAEMDTRRQLDYHERYLREVARVSARPEVDGDIEAVRRSLAFMSQNGSAAQSKTARAVARVFSITGDEETRSLCLMSLYRINNSAAKKELLAIYENQNLDPRWRDLSVGYLRLAAKEGQRSVPRQAKSVIKIDGE